MKLVAYSFQLTLLLLFFIHSTSQAQGGMWAQMHGSAGTGALGWYGTKGVPDPLNTPSGKYQGAYWTDLQGNFWLFGGFCPFGYSNDLWKYDVATMRWIWINGPQWTNDQNGEFGAQGVPSPNNYPSARTFGPNCWTDNNGDLWLFGGYGYDVNYATGSLSDLWRYNIASNSWTWMSGPNTVNQAPVFGTIGVAAAANTPGSRQECKSGWVDDQNNLWLFGGLDGATAATSTSVRNDVWKYTIATNMWTWMKGSQALNNGGSYGTKGVEAATNNPPSRLSFTKWKGKDGNFYVFAGGNSSTARNDVWRYNPFTNNWTWLSGTNTVNNAGTYNAQCNPQPTEYPKARIENQTVATTTKNCTEIFWSFGGLKSLANAESFYDLWLYNLSTNKWTWVSGTQNTNYVGNYGPLYTPSPTNMIGSRGGVFIWTDTANNLWVFGGITYDSTISALGLKNDLWKFVPDSSCFDYSLNSVLTLVPPADTILCTGDTTGMNVPDLAILDIQPMSGVKYSIDSSRLVFSPNTTTTYTITGYESGICPGRDTITFTIVVVPYPNADFTLSPTESFISDPTFILTNTSQLAATYQWIYQGIPFSTNFNVTYDVTDSGLHCFTLIAYNSEGCSDSVTHCGTKLIPDKIFIPNAFSPNGDQENDIVKIIANNITLQKFSIYNRWGELVFKTTDINKGWDGKFKGSDCEIGSYYYYIEYEAYKVKKTVKGDISLIR